MNIANIPSVEMLQLGPLEEGSWLRNKRVFIRVDFNVPLNKKTGAISDDARIVAALPTIRFVVEAGAKVILASHLGRPKGKRVEALSLEVVGSRLAALTDYEVFLPEDCIGDAPKKVIHDLRVMSESGQGHAPAQVCLLENLRFNAGEKKDDETFVRALSELCDVYINDAFGVMHRAHASVHGLPRTMRDRGMGMLVRKELSSLQRLVDKPERPLVAVLGGVKVSDKIDVIEALLARCDAICIGGAMANTFLSAQGHEMQHSLVEEDKQALARTLIEKADKAGVELLLPSDVVVGDNINAQTGQLVKVTSLPQGCMALDIGDDTILRFSKVVAAAKTVFWNGPMGLFETKAFSKGTFAVADALSRADGFTVVGGGDSAAAVRQAGGGIAARIDHISTGGGASLAFVEGKRLPGIAALRQGALSS